jgi:hypothetical protein
MQVFHFGGNKDTRSTKHSIIEAFVLRIGGNSCIFNDTFGNMEGSASHADRCKHCLQFDVFLHRSHCFVRNVLLWHQISFSFENKVEL